MQNLASRRAVVAALAASMAALATPCAKAQAQSPRTARVGWLMFTSSGRYAELTARGYVKGLAEGGYVEGRNLTFEKRSAEGDPHKLRGLARELVAAKVDAIFAPAKMLADAAWYASRSIPTVIATVTDPITVEYALSLARPGKHITGVTTASAELIGKRLQLLAEMVPGLRRVAIPIDPESLASCKEEMDLMEAAARKLGLVLVRVPIKRGSPDIDATLRRAVADKAQAIVTAPMTSDFDVTDKIAALAKSHRLPFMHDVPQLAGEGLAVYGPDFEDIFRRAGLVTARILKGERPAEMPIEEPREFRFIVNKRTASALGLTLSPAILLRADTVIE